MPADNGENVRVLLGNFQGAVTAIEVGSDADDFGNSGGGGALDDLWEFVGEIGVIEVGVGVVEWRHTVSGRPLPRMDTDKHG